MHDQYYTMLCSHYAMLLGGGGKMQCSESKAQHALLSLRFRVKHTPPPKAQRSISHASLKRSNLVKMLHKGLFFERPISHQRPFFLKTATESRKFYSVRPTDCDFKSQDRGHSKSKTMTDRTLYLSQAILKTIEKKSMKYFAVSLKRIHHDILSVHPQARTLGSL